MGAYWLTAPGSLRTFNQIRRTLIVFFTIFDSLTPATGSISILGCSVIVYLDLYSLTALRGDLNIYDNPELLAFLLYGLKSVNWSPNPRQEIPNPGDTVSIDLTALQTVRGNINITGPVFSLTETQDSPYVTIEYIWAQNQIC
jgi:hypothetical protein